MGGYPNYTLLAKTAGIKTGFVGKRAAPQRHMMLWWTAS